MRIPACPLPILQPRNSPRCFSGVNIDGTHSIVGYTSPLFSSLPLAEVCALQPAPPLPFSSPLSSRCSSCDGKFESRNGGMTFEPVHY